MNHDEALDVARRLATSWTDTHVPFETQEIWAEALEICDYECARRAHLELLREPGSKRPAVGDLIARTKLLEGKLQGIEIPEPNEIADYVLMVARRVGPYEWTTSFPDEFPLVREIFGTQDWCERVCRMTYAEQGTVASQIRETWREARSKALRQAAQRPAEEIAAALAGTTPARRLSNREASGRALAVVSDIAARKAMP